jgi:hypothetical protein
MRTTFAPLPFLALLAAFQSVAARPPECKSVQDWNEVPVDVRAALERIVGPVAAKGQDFNATDVLQTGLSPNRFLSACERTDMVAVALERGGRGYRIEVFHYGSGKVIRQWTQLISKAEASSVNLLEPPAGRQQCLVRSDGVSAFGRKRTSAMAAAK